MRPQGRINGLYKRNMGQRHGRFYAAKRSCGIYPTQRVINMRYVKRTNNIKKVLDEISNGASTKYANVGFLGNATYPDGTPVASVAFWQEFGVLINRAAQQDRPIYRKLNKNGTLARKGRFVKASDANLITKHDVPEYTITIPSRPFFRTAIAQNKQKWVDMAMKMLQSGQYDADMVLKKIGKQMQEDIQKSIVDWKEPPNAASTIRKKGGRDNPLIDSRQMLNSVDYEIVNRPDTDNAN